MNPSSISMYQLCVADTSGGGELRLESQNHEDTSLTLPTQVLSGIYVSGSLPLLGFTHVHFTSSSNYFQCDAECTLSVPHRTGSLLQKNSPVWALVPTLLVTHPQAFLSPRVLTSCLFPSQPVPRCAILDF